MAEQPTFALFRAQLCAKLADDAAACPHFDQLVEQHWAEAIAAWPQFELPADRYFQYLADKMNHRDEASVRQMLQSVPAADLYLAAACTEGIEAAIECFCRTLVPPLRGSLARVGIDAGAIDDVEAKLLEALFVPSRGEGLIKNYNGSGRLQSWLRSIALRIARRDEQKRPHQADEDELVNLQSAIADPEFDLLRSRYGPEVKSAFSHAFSSLDLRHRTILRQYHLDGLTIDQLASQYDVNRSTTARWVAKARSAVLEAARTQLQQHLTLSSHEVDSLIRLIRSHIDLSLRELE